MSRERRPLVIDARPRGPRGPFAVERVQGRTVLDHLLDAAESACPAQAVVAVHAREDEHPAFASSVAGRPSGRFVLAVGPTPHGAAILRSDRLYDPPKLRRVLKRGQDPEAAVLWRLDRPQGLAGADDELARRRTYQPLGRFWALNPARRLARALVPTRVRPNGVTLAAAGLFLTSAALVAFAPATIAARVAVACGLAFALVLDTADGHLARLQGTASAFGRWLDSWLDEVSDMALHAAIAWSAFARTGASGWLAVGMAYAMGKYLFVAATQEPESGTTVDALDVPARPSLAASAVRLVGHADVRWHLWIVLAAAGRLDAALIGYAAYFPARALLVATRKAVRRG
jgi:phosphatidylglycerophosphate synthase